MKHLFNKLICRLLCHRRKFTIVSVARGGHFRTSRERCGKILSESDHSR